MNWAFLLKYYADHITSYTWNLREPYYQTNNVTKFPVSLASQKKHTFFSPFLDSSSCTCFFFHWMFLVPKSFPPLKRNLTILSLHHELLELPLALGFAQFKVTFFPTVSLSSMALNQTFRGPISLTYNDSWLNPILQCATILSHLE